MAATKSKTKRSKPGSYWSGEVTLRSHALDLEAGVFTWKSPRRIAESLKRSAEISDRRKGTPFQSAMSMLNFYINRAGKGLDARQLAVLQKAKEELRRGFGGQKASGNRHKAEGRGEVVAAGSDRGSGLGR